MSEANLDFKAVICDLDGLLVNTDEVMYNAAKHLFHDKLQIDILDEDFAESFGQKSFLKVFAEHYHISEADHPELLEQYRHYLAAEKIGIKAGAKELLDNLKNQQIKIGLASNSRAQFVQPTIDALNIASYFSCVTTIDDVGNPKPAGEMYKLSAQKLGFEPKVCVVLEDSPTGVEAGVNAGCQVLFVPNRLLDKQERTDIISRFSVQMCQNLSEVRSVLEI